MTRSFRPQFEPLEGRITPASWLDGTNLTVSVMPDGTDLLGQPSRLFELLGPEVETWQRELLRAFQTWAIHADLNIGLVDDLGLPGGVSGLPQSDPRFGDIRVGALPMSSDVLAVASPPDPLAGTWSGDVFLNSIVAFNAGAGSRDLFSVLLHEVGHSLGLEHVEDPTSIMIEHYAGMRGAELGASDILRLQALYGPRSADGWEGLTGNDTLATAADLTLGKSDGDRGVLLVRADVTTPGDVDFYELQTPGNTTAVRLTLRTAGLSLLAGRLAVYDAGGRELAATASGGEPGIDLVLDLAGVRNRTLYIRVAGDSDDVFAVGGYRLSVDLVGANPPPPSAGTGDLPPASHPPLLLGSNERLRAVRLAPRQSDPTRHSYRLRAEFADGAEARALYVIKAPTAQNMTDEPRTLTVTLRSLDWPAWQPRVVIYDAQGRFVPFEVVIFGDGTATIRLDGVAPNRDYYLLIQGEGGDYFLGADFGLEPTEMETLAVGWTHETAEFPLEVERNSLLHLLLESNEACRASILNEAGQILFTLETDEVRSGQVFLPAGTYVVRVEGIGTGGVGTYRLRGVRLSDPIGPELELPLATPAPTGDTTSSPPEPTPTAGPVFLEPTEATALPAWGDVGADTFTVTASTSLSIDSTAVLPGEDTLFLPVWDGVWVAPLLEPDADLFDGESEWTEALAEVEPIESTPVESTTSVTTALPAEETNDPVLDVATEEPTSDTVLFPALSEDAEVMPSDEAIAVI